MATLELDSLVSASDLSHGEVGRTLDKVAEGRTMVVMRNSKPAAVILSPAEYERLVQADEDLSDYLEATRREKEGGATLSAEEFWGDYRPLDDGYEPEFE